VRGYGVGVHAEAWREQTVVVEPDVPSADGRADAYYGRNRDRLLAVRARYDPDDVFSFPQSLSPTVALG
jgi:Berberine and berberine like